MRVLDLSAGRRAIWFNKNNPIATYIDKRKIVKPDYVMSSTKLPEAWKGKFNLVVFDPPHMCCGPKSNMAKFYGHHTTKQILRLVEKTAVQAHKVTKSKGLMALKWNDHDIKLQRVFDLMPQWYPLFGHITKDGPGSKTYWVMLLRLS